MGGEVMKKKRPSTYNLCNLNLFESREGGSSRKKVSEYIICARQRGRWLRWFHGQGYLRYNMNYDEKERNRWRVMVRQQHQGRPENVR